MHWNIIQCQLCLVTTSILDNNLISLMSLLQEIISPVIFSWVEKSLTHPIQRDIFLGKIWIWISLATDLCRWPNETATSKLTRVWHSVILTHAFMSCFPQFPYVTPAPHEPVKTLRSLVNIRKDSLRLVRYIVNIVMAWRGCWTMPQCRLYAEIREPWQPTFVFQICRYKDDSDSTAEDTGEPRVLYSVEFCFDTDARVAITLYCQAFEEFANGMAM